jgi:hypothetical protein
MKLEKKKPAVGPNLAREPVANGCAACLAPGQAWQLRPNLPWGCGLARAARVAARPRLQREAAGWRYREQEDSSRVPFCHGRGCRAHLRWPVAGMVAALELFGGRGGAEPAREGHGVRFGTGRQSQIWRKGSGVGSSSVTLWSERTAAPMELLRGEFGQKGWPVPYRRRGTGGA